MSELVVNVDYLFFIKILSYLTIMFSLFILVALSSRLNLFPENWDCFQAPLALS